MFAIFAAFLTVAAPAPRVIHVTARRFEYQPSEIHIGVGEDAVLEFGSLDRVHGFSIPALHIRSDIEPGKTIRVALPKVPPGTDVGRDVFCGSHHDEMAGELVVE